MFKLDLEKAEEPIVILIVYSFPSGFLSVYAQQWDCWIIWQFYFQKNCGKFLKRWEYQTTFPVSWEICMQVRKQQLELDMEQWTSSKLGKEFVKIVQCHPVYVCRVHHVKCWTWWSTSWNQDCQVSQSISSVTQSCPTLCDTMDCSTPGLLVHHQLSEFTQTHVHWVSDAIQSSHPLDCQEKYQ